MLTCLPASFLFPWSDEGETGFLQRPPIVRRSTLKNSPDFYGNLGETLFSLDYSSLITAITGFIPQVMSTDYCHLHGSPSLHLYVNVAFESLIMKELPRTESRGTRSDLNRLNADECYVLHTVVIFIMW